MGNHQSYPRKAEDIATSSGGSFRKGLSRSSSSGTDDVQDKSTTRLLPIEKLAKILTARAQAEEGTAGITLHIFIRYLFPRYILFGEKLFNNFHAASKVKSSYITTSAFKYQCEKFLAILDDAAIRDLLVKMFSVNDENSDNEMVTQDALRSLLMCAYQVSMDHYSEGPQMCLSINKTLKAVVESCFHTKSQLSGQYVSHWLEMNCPRLLLPLHRFAVHALATSYRVLENAEGPPLAVGLELSTPVLEQPFPFGSNKHVRPHLLQMSMSWLLAGALPSSYSRPQRAHSPNNSDVNLSSQTFLMKLLCAFPSHWLILYDSEEMGLGSNRFLHHVMAYKGATLCLVRAEGGSVFCIASPNEWKDSHLYWGGEDCAVFQLLPKFLLLEKGSKMLYLNTSVRGYPFGLRAGKDPRKPIIAIDGGFEKIEYRKIPYSLECIEVWGCGDQASRDAQLDVKKWEVREAEKQRNVKLSADDWLDHPDRYLLELAGRPQYHQNPT